MRALTLFAGLLTVCTTAHAGLIVTIERTGTSVDFPQLSLENDSDELITAVMLTIGNDTKHFDYVQEKDKSDNLTSTLIKPDALNGEERSDFISWTFTGFGKNEFLVTKLDLDSDDGPATVDWQEVLFNNGELPNALLTATWFDGMTVSTILHDEPNRDPLEPYTVRLDRVAAPEPSTMIMAFIALLTLSFRLLTLRMQ